MRLTHNSGSKKRRPAMRFNPNLKAIRWVSLALLILCLQPSLQINAQRIISIGASVSGDGNSLGALTDGLTPRNHKFTTSAMQVDLPRLWYSHGAGARFVVDLGSIRTVDAFRIWGDMSLGSGYVIDQFTIERSSNGSSFTPVVSRHTAKLIGWWMPIVIDFPGTVSTRYVRFTVNRIDSESPQGASLSEFEVLSNELAFPTVIQQPRSFVGPPGSVATLEVSAEGPQISGWQWQRNGTPILGATNSSLTITNTLGDGTGTYRLVVTNPAGSAASSNANVGAFWIQSELGKTSLEVEWVPGVTFGLETNSSPFGSWGFWANTTLASSHISIPIQPSATNLFFRIAPPYVPPGHPGGGRDD